LVQPVQGLRKVGYALPQLLHLVLGLPGSPQYLGNLPGGLEHPGMREVFQIARYQRYCRSQPRIGVVPGIKATSQTGQKRHQRRDDRR
jgi:hypothetical protein